MLFNYVAGIDVSKDFSYLTIIDSHSNTILKPFKFLHNLKSLYLALDKIKEVVQEPSDLVMVMEDTDRYSGILTHFFKNYFTVELINPLQSNSIKNVGMRKVKNDKSDAYLIALTFLLGKYRVSSPVPDIILDLRQLIRTYFKVSDELANFTKSFSSNLTSFLPNYSTVFSRINSKSSLQSLSYILNDCFDYDTYMANIPSIAHQSSLWAEKKFNQLTAIIEESSILAPRFSSSKKSLRIYLDIIQSFMLNKQRLCKDIIAISSTLSDYKLLLSIPGIGPITASTIIAEIGSISRFKSPKQLIAFIGLDPGVYQSGNFCASSNRISKRGNKLLRRAFYIIALASIRLNSGKNANNIYLREYYLKKSSSKPNKVALIAVSQKLIRYVFAVLRDQKSFELREPATHKQHFWVA